MAKLGDDLFITACTQLSRGVLPRSFSRDGRTLIANSDQPAKGKLTRTLTPPGGEDAFDDLLACGIPSGESGYEGGKLLRASLRLPPKCPFFLYTSIPWTAEVSYFADELTVGDGAATGNSESEQGDAGGGAVMRPDGSASASGSAGGASMELTVSVSDPDPENPDEIPVITTHAAFGGMPRPCASFDTPSSPITGSQPCGGLLSGSVQRGFGCASEAEGTTFWDQSVAIAITFSAPTGEIEF